MAQGLPAQRLDLGWRRVYFVFMRNDETRGPPFDIGRLKAIASPVRIAILDDLKRPAELFPPQAGGDFEADGVCAAFIRDRLGSAAATASRHLTLLTDAGLLVATRKRGWTFYRRDEAAIRRFTQQLLSDL
jgi:DNA-binding transcriptional ArsR family regulator